MGKLVISAQRFNLGKIAQKRFVQPGVRKALSWPLNLALLLSWNQHNHRNILHCIILLHYYNTLCCIYCVIALYIMLHSYIPLFHCIPLHYYTLCCILILHSYIALHCIIMLHYYIALRCIVALQYIMLHSYIALIYCIYILILHSHGALFYYIIIFPFDTVLLPYYFCIITQHYSYIIIYFCKSRSGLGNQMSASSSKLVHPILDLWQRCCDTWQNVRLFTRLSWIH